MSRVNANFETVLEKVARMIARNYGVSVVIRGNQAFTDGKTIHLPMFEDMSREMFDDLLGFTDHEVCHVKYTTFKEIKKVVNGFHKHFLNAVEDSRIELELPKEYPGSAMNLRRLNRKWVAKLNESWDKIDPKTGKSELPWPVRLIFAMRNVYDGVTPRVDDDFKPLFDHVRHMVEKLPLCKSTGELREETKKIIDAINEKRRQLALGLPDPEEEMEGEPDEASVPLNDKDKKKKRKTSKDLLDPATEMSDSDDGEAGEGDEGGSDKEDDKESDGKGKDKKDQSKKKNKSKGDDSDESEDDEDSEGNSDGDSNGKDSDKKDKDKKGKGKNKDKSEDSEGDEDSDSDESTGSSSSNKGKGKATKNKPTPSDEEITPEIETRRNYARWGELETKMMEEKADQEDSEFDKHVSSSETYIENQVEEEIKVQDVSPRNYRGMYYDKDIKKAVSLPYSKEYDEVKDHSGKGSITKYGEMKKQVMPVVNPIRMALERMLKVKENAKITANRERGRLNKRSLHQLAADRSFRYPFEELTRVDTKNVAVELLIDLSGSMHGSKIEMARQTALAIGESLAGLNIAFEMTGFHTDGSRELASKVAGLSSVESQRFNRFGEKLVHHVFKSFDTVSLTGITNAHSAGANADGESLIWAAKRLALRREKRKILFVFSDGQPAYGGADHMCLAGDLKRVVEDLVKSRINVVGFGIQTDAVSAFYPDWVIVQELKDLPVKVMNKLRKLLEKGF